MMRQDGNAIFPNRNVPTRTRRPAVPLLNKDDQG